MAGANSRDAAAEGAGDRAALLIIDMINCFDFEGASDLITPAVAAAHKTLKLRQEMERLGWPVIYVNDNFGEWHSNASLLVERALEHDSPVAEILRPGDDDFFVIKPQFSGFYATNLPVLLPKLGISKLILSGVAADICVLFTAADAHMRQYDLWVPEDVVAACSTERKSWALDIMRASMGAEICATDDLSPAEWIRRRGESD